MPALCIQCLSCSRSSWENVSQSQQSICRSGLTCSDFTISLGDRIIIQVVWQTNKHSSFVLKHYEEHSIHFKVVNTNQYLHYLSLLIHFLYPSLPIPPLFPAKDDTCNDWFCFEIGYAFTNNNPGLDVRKKWLCICNCAQDFISIIVHHPPSCSVVCSPHFRINSRVGWCSCCSFKFPPSAEWKARSCGFAHDELLIKKAFARRWCCCCCCYFFFHTTTVLISLHSERIFSLVRLSWSLFEFPRLEPETIRS